VDASLVADLIHAGGVSALAVIVWLELREHRNDLKAHREKENEVLGALGLLVESVKGLVQGLVSRFVEEDKVKLAEEAARKAAQDAASRVREIIRDEISGVHGESLIGPDDDTPVEGIKATKKQPRAQSSPYSIKKPDKDR
jgi:hypothetical protein